MREDSRHHHLTLVALSLGILASRLLLIHRSGSPEPDSLAMVAGMNMALRNHVPLREAFIYGREGSPGMYLVGRFVYPLFFRDPSHLLAFLNGITVLASAAIVWPAYRIARRFFTHALAAALVLVALLAPAVWELSTYFHPELPAVALLLFAIDLAAGADESRSGTLRSTVAVVLGAAAFLCRSHVLFAVPGLLLAALTSTRRARHLTTLTAAVTVGVAAYAVLQTAAAGPGRLASVPGYVSMIVAMYTSSFSLPGLTRSVVWAICGMGVATVMALIVVPMSGKARLSHGSLGRGLGVGLSWALPAILFWLPQPVPILRHYVLPTFGLVLALGALLSQFPRRAPVVTATLIIVLNVAIPEVAYRAYNAARPHTPKTPHGAVFYNHEVTVERIRRFEAASAGVVRAARIDDAPGVVVFAQWEGYAQILFVLSQQFSGLKPISTTVFFPSVQERRYRAQDLEIQFINYVYFEDPELKRRGVDLIREGITERYAVFLPRELANGPFAGMLSGLPVTVY